MKKLLSLISLILCCAVLFTACTKGGGGTGKQDFVVPDDLLTEAEYRAEIDALLQQENFSKADAAYLAKIDNLSQRLQDMIRYNTEIPECTGTTYYVSNNGNDDNDGKSPKTAWATLEKVNKYNFQKGDMVLFERGSVWRGYLFARSNMTYAAYGEGHKPKILASLDGKTYGEWKPTDKVNVWVLDKKFSTKDIGSIVFNSYDADATYAVKVQKESDLDTNLEFLYKGSVYTDGAKDFKLYLVCKEGNPAEVFDSIEISLFQNNIQESPKMQNILFKNLELLFGTSPYSGNNGNNIRFSYCVMGWHGGHISEVGGPRMCGGVGAIGDGDNITTDNCYIYQQFDSGVTPQVGWDSGVVFENIVTYNCLFDAVEWTLEYWNGDDSSTDNCFKGLYFGYNMCLRGGYGFGDKAGSSAYIKSWGYENTCYDSIIESNVFDRAMSHSLEVTAYEQSARGKKLNLDYAPVFRNNIYIQVENKRFATLQKQEYRYTKTDLEKIQALGFDKGAIYMFAEKTAQQ